MLKKKESKTKVETKLEKLYLLNKKDPKKVNDNLLKLVADQDLLLSAYGKIQANSGSMTIGVDEDDTVDGFNRKLIERTSKSILEGNYTWKDIKQVEIPKPGKKKKRPLGIPTFSDKLVQESIRTVLMTIYEPVFQEYEYNHGFRPKRSTHTAIRSITTKSQGMEYALEGDIVGAYNSLKHGKLMEFLKKKISDKRLLKLIENGLKHNIHFKDKITLNTLGVPQGAIISPLLFNIYMHEFDLEIERIAKELEIRNEKENRKRLIHRMASTVTMRIHRRGKILDRIKNKPDFDKKAFYKILKQIQKDKKLQRTLPSKNLSRRPLRIHYTRYADDWILTTNLREQEVITLKEHITKWLKENLELDLDQEKTYITNLKKNKAKFLGFTLFRHKKNISRLKHKKTGRVYRRRSNDRLFVGIDHERVKNRMKEVQIINDKYFPRHVGLFCSLKPWDIVTKFNQKTIGFINYYYAELAYPSDLGYYYYALRYSCLKTLSHRMRISISQIQKIYGNRIVMTKIERGRDPKTGLIKEKEGIVFFPEYLEIMDKIGDRIASEVIQGTKLIPDLKFANVIEGLDPLPLDALETINIKVNVRTGSKIDKNCCICGIISTPNNPIEMHHIKHIRKGKIVGFSLIMKSLGRKRIPCCKQCHRRIHNGDYDGLSLSDLHSPEAAL